MSDPNVIVVLCDQLRAFEVGCYGNDTIRTPHIDRLAAEGVRFDLAISNNPVCMPARSALLITARRSTAVMPAGTEMTTLGFTHWRPPCTLVMK